LCCACWHSLFAAMRLCWQRDLTSLPFAAACRCACHRSQPTTTPAHVLRGGQTKVAGCGGCSRMCAAAQGTRTSPQPGVRGHAGHPRLAMRIVWLRTKKYSDLRHGMHHPLPTYQGLARGILTPYHSSQSAPSVSPSRDSDAVSLAASRCLCTAMGAVLGDH